MITTLTLLAEERMKGKRPPGGVYLSTLGEVRLVAPCILVTPSTPLNTSCLINIDVLVVCRWPNESWVMDLIAAVRDAQPANLDILDPILRLRVGYICSGRFFLTQQPFSWGMEYEQCNTSTTT